MPNYSITTSRGPVVFNADAPWPKVVAVHGFRRSIRDLFWWRSRLAGVGFLNLPGHGKAPELDEVSMAAWIDAWTQALRQWPDPPVIIAESLGAILAMSVPARGVVAVEPLLSVDNLWPQRVVIDMAARRGEPIDARYTALFDEPFDWVLDRISTPTLLIAGDEMLLPQRRLPRAPSLLTDDDFNAYAAHPLVEAHRIPGGHALMDDNPDAVVAMTEAFLQRR